MLMADMLPLGFDAAPSSGDVWLSGQRLSGAGLNQRSAQTVASADSLSGETSGMTGPGGPALCARSFQP